MFRKLTNIVVAAAFVIAIFSCGKSSDLEITKSEANTPKEEVTMPNSIKITVSGRTLPVKIIDNGSTRALVENLRKSSVSFTAQDYGGFEKVGSLGRSLPTSNIQITTQPGDVILYSGNQIVLFYASNTWSYTRIGRIEYSTLDELKSFLKAGEGNISVTLSL